MIHFNSFAKCSSAAAPSGLIVPLTPAAYVRLRRTASRLTIAQVASRCAPLAKRHDAAVLISMLEDEGVTARQRDTIEQLAIAFPIDVDVYFQLATEPADRHPRICRGCGCSQWDPCYATDGSGPCGWASEHACTCCAGEPAELEDAS